MLTVTTPLAFTQTNVTGKAEVTATYAVTNTGGTPVRVEYLMVGLDSATNTGAGIGYTPPLTIYPGQTYRFSRSGPLAAGTWTAWPASYDGTTWTRLAGNTTLVVR